MLQRFTLSRILLATFVITALHTIHPSHAFSTHTTIIRKHSLGPCSKQSQSLLTLLNQVEDSIETVEEQKQEKQPKVPLSRPPRKTSFRMQLYSILNEPIIEVAASAAVLLSTFLVALNTLNNLSPEAYSAINETLFGLNIIFALDFFVRWYAAGQFKLKYLTKPLALVDIFVVLLPLFLGSFMPMLDEMGVLGDTQIILALNFQDSSGLQVLLLLRVLRLKRVLTDINTFGRFEVALGLRPNDVRPYQLQLARVLLSIFTLLSVSSGLIYTCEHNVNPEIPDYFTALYFGLTTLTTVGYGDIVPMTFQGRLVVCGSILVGVAVLPAQAAKLVDAIIESQSDEGGGDRFRMPTKSLARVVRVESRATDGMGPSGKPIDISSIDEGDVGRISCDQCGAYFHREDANFCWSCGERLL